MESRIEESIVNHGVAISRIKDCEDDMQICKGDIDNSKLLMASMGRDLEMLEAAMGSFQPQLASAQRDVRMLEASMESAHEQLEGLGDRVDGCYAETRRVCSLSETNVRSLGAEIQRVQRESRKEIEGLFSKFERVNDIIDKKTVRMDEELDWVVALVGEKIEARVREMTSDWLEAMAVEERRRKDLEGKVAFLEEKVTNCLTHQRDTVALVLSLQNRIWELEEAVMADSEGSREEVVSSSSSDLDPIENMVAIPVLAPSIIHTLVEIPEEFVPPILRPSASVASTPSPEYVQALEEDLSHAGIPEYWADPEARDS
jgi:chromosome segregation ATPase